MKIKTILLQQNDNVKYMSLASLSKAISGIAKISTTKGIDSDLGIDVAGSILYINHGRNAIWVDDDEDIKELEKKIQDNNNTMYLHISLTGYAWFFFNKEDAEKTISSYDVD